LTVPVLKEVLDHKRGNYHDVIAVYQVIYLPIYLNLKLVNL